MITSRRNFLKKAGASSVLITMGSAVIGKEFNPLPDKFIDGKPIKSDVIVVGGGSAGMGAAIAAARLGANVLVIEQGNAPGGTSTIGNLNEFYAHPEGLGNVFMDMYAELKRAGQFMPDRFYNHEYLKLIWCNLLKRAGVRMLYNAQVYEALVDGGVVRGVRAACCGKTVEIRGRFFIDTTGEGDLAACAGAEYEMGDPEQGRTLHMSLVCTLADTGKPVKPWLPEGVEPIRSRNELPGLPVFVKLADNRVYCNMTKVMLHNPVDPVSLSEAETLAREQLIRVLHYVQTYHYPTYTLASTGAHIGVREGRRIVGDYKITEADILGGTLTRWREDFVAVATGPIDFHSLTKPGNTGWRQNVASYGIPFGALMVKGYANLLTAGKCICGDQVAMSSYRMTPTCCAMGQGAGTLAYLYLKNGLDNIRQLDHSELQRVLRENGMVTDPKQHRLFSGGESGKDGL